MQTVRQSWTDERLDAFAAHTDHRFDGVDRRFDEVDRRFDEVDRRFDRVEGALRDLNHRIDGLQRTLVHGAIAMTAAILAGFGGMVGVLAALI